MTRIKSAFYYKALLFMIGLTLNTAFSTAQTINSRSVLKKAIDSILQSHVDNDKIPGAVIQIKKGGEVVYKQAYGYAQKFNYAHEQLTAPEKMTTEHLFD